MAWLVTIKFPTLVVNWTFGLKLGLDIVQSYPCILSGVADCSSWFLLSRAMIIVTISPSKSGCLEKNLDRLVRWACWMCCKFSNLIWEFTLNDNWRPIGTMFTNCDSNLFTIAIWRLNCSNPCWMRGLIICSWEVMFTLCLMSKMYSLSVTPCVYCLIFNSHTSLFSCYGLTIMFSSHAPSCLNCIFRCSTHNWGYCSNSYDHLDGRWIKLNSSIDSVTSRYGEKPTLLGNWLG